MSMYTQHAPVLDLQAAWVQDSSPCSLLRDTHATGRLASEKGTGISATTEALSAEIGTAAVGQRQRPKNQREGAETLNLDDVMCLCKKWAGLLCKMLCNRL